MNAQPTYDSDGVAIDLPDAEATAALARLLAPMIRARDVIALTGDLGAGKSTFARALINAVPHPDGTTSYEHVPSPTFTLVQTYDRLPGTIWHFDLYRLGDPGEVEELGWDEARDEGIILVEWPDRLGPLAPCDRLDITMVIPAADDTAHKGRIAILQGGAAWHERLEALANDD